MENMSKKTQNEAIQYCQEAEKAAQFTFGQPVLPKDIERR